MDNQTTTNSSCIISNPIASMSEATIYVTVAAAISLSIIAMNSLIVSSIAKFPNLRLTCNILVANLAVADLMVGVLMIPFNMAATLNPQILDTKYGCLINQYIRGTCIGYPIIALFIISIDRICAVAFPLKYKMINTKRIAYWSCIVSWSLWILFSTSTYIFNQYKCSNICVQNTVISIILYRIGSSVLGILLLCSCMCFCITWRLLREFDKRNPNNRNKDLKTQNRLMTLVFALFVLFLSPAITSAVYTASTDTHIDDRLMNEWLVLISTFNSVLNGVIYGFKKPKFRQAYISIIKCKTHNRIISSEAPTVSRRIRHDNNGTNTDITTTS